MNASVIEDLCKYLPAPEEDVVQDNFRIRSAEMQLGINDPEQSRFLYAYKDLGFGWNYARTMAFNRLELPPILEGCDDVLWRAYLYARNPQRYRDPIIIEAASYISPGLSKERAVINALLVNPDITVERIASRLNRRPEVIEAYELLFFNISDRRLDHLFLSSIVYPQGRLVEMYDHYLRNESLEHLLMRAGYNNGADDVLYLAGFPSQLMHKTSGSETPQRLEALIMANGYILARNGWLNQQTNNAGISNARTLLAAAKQGGQDDKGSPFYGKGGDTLRAEVQRVKGLQAQQRAQAYYAAQEGKVVDA